MTDPLHPDRLLTRDETAEAFGVSKRWLEHAATHGNGPRMVKVGRAVRYRVADVRAWIDAQTVASTSQTPGQAKR